MENEDYNRKPPLRPISGLHGVFARYRCTVGGQLAQDIDGYNRHCELYNSLKRADARHSDDIEGSAQPRWDDDWRHKDANGLDQFVRLNGAGDAVEPSPDSNSNFRDHNAWGDISNRYPRHSMTGIGGGEHVRLGHKFRRGFLESNFCLPVRYSPLEIEVTLVSDKFVPIIQPVPTATATAQGGD